MRIESMTATFGKLQADTLTLKPSLNVLQMPNETGKSTWCAFLLCMLYGVDTSERETRTNFPIKKHYLPWSGKAMEGQLQIVHEGRRITIERSSTARAPLGVFRAYDTDSGLAIKELTAQNCGQTLLGIPRQVFERSAFLRQDGMTIQMEATLEQRLGALVTTGDETISYQEAERLLRERRNRCRHNKTGLIPQTEAALEGVKERLSRLRQLHEEMTQARLDEQRLRGELGTLRAQLATLQAQQAQESQDQLAKAKAEASDKIETANQLKSECSNLPPMQELQNWEAKLNALVSQQHTLALDAASIPQPTSTPAFPPALSGLSGEDMLQKANVDASQMRLLQTQKKPTLLPWLIPALLLCLLGACMLGQMFVYAAVAIGLGLALGIIGIINYNTKHRAWQTAQHDLNVLYNGYGVHTPEEVQALAHRCCEDYGRWLHACKNREEELRTLKTRRVRLDADCEELFQIICPVLKCAASLSEASVKVRQAMEVQLRAESAHRSAEQAYRHYRTLKEAIGTVHTPTAAQQTHVPVGKTIHSIHAEIVTAERELQNLRSTLDRGEGQSSTLGDPIELEARRQQLTERLAALNEEYDALDMALKVLGKSNEALQNRFSPQLTALATKYLSRLTDGTYSRLMLDQNLGASLYPAQVPASKEASYFSGGTKDQLYFAVRLAVSQLLAPGTPLILDDALVRFDDDRLQKAMQVLQEESKDRQVLLFTCQNRENAALQAMQHK